MRRAHLMMFLAVAVAIGLTGCCGPQGRCLTDCLGGSCDNSPENCSTCTSGCQTCGDPGAGSAYDSCCEACGGRGCGTCLGRSRNAFTPGPPSAAITYPYYTVRAPRDFFAQDPQSIGP